MLLWTEAKRKAGLPRRRSHFSLSTKDLATFGHSGVHFLWLRFSDCVAPCHDSDIMHGAWIQVRAAEHATTRQFLSFRNLGISLVDRTWPQWLRLVFPGAGSAIGIYCGMNTARCKSIELTILVQHFWESNLCSVILISSMVAIRFPSLVS